MSSTREGRSTRRATTSTHPTTPVQGKRKRIGDTPPEQTTSIEVPTRRLRSHSQPARTQPQKPRPPTRCSARLQTALLKAPARSAGPRPIQDTHQPQTPPSAQLAEQPCHEAHFDGPMTAPNLNTHFQSLMAPPPSLDPEFELQEPLGVPCSAPPFQTAFDSSSSTSPDTILYSSQPRQEAEEEGEENSKEDESDDDDDSEDLESSTPSTSPLPYSRPTAFGQEDSGSDCPNPTPTPGPSSAPRILKPLPRRPHNARAPNVLPIGPSMTPQPLSDSSTGFTSSGSGLQPLERIGSSSLKRKPQRYASLQEAADDPTGPKELKAIHEFFHFTPPEIVKADNHSGSRATREPQKYDRHLDPKITLKHVLYCPDIEEDLLHLAEATVMRRWNDDEIPSLDSGDDFPSPVRREHLTKRPVTNVSEESGVVTFYHTLSKQVATVATTLYFGRDSWTYDILNFDRVCTGQGQDAVADGYLRVNLKMADEKEVDGSFDRLEAEAVQGRNLLTWEFKSLTAGAEEVMCALMELAGHPFDWEYCEYVCGSEKCKDVHQPTQSSGPEDEILMHEPPVGPQAAAAEAQTIWPRSIAVSDATRQWGDRDPKLEVSKMDRQHAKWIIQQVWAQLVKNDATLAVIGSGNFEIYCRRDRIDQTLSLSNLITVQKCKNYGQLQVGLYLAALHDAKIRFTLARKQIKSPQDQRSSPKLPPDEILVKACSRNKLILTCQRKFIRQRDQNTKFVLENTQYIRHQEQSEHSDDENERIRVQITSKISDSVFVGNLRIGTSAFKGCGDFDGKIIIKVSDNDSSNLKLRNQYSAFNELNKGSYTEDLVPTVIGFFCCSRRGSSDLFVMLLQHVGTDLDQFIWPSKPDCGLPQLIDLKDSFVTALRAIHAAQVIHGAITRHHHLIFRGSKKVRYRPENKIDAGKGRKKTKAIVSVVHQVAFISFDLEQASSYSKDFEMSQLESLFPDTQGFKSPPVLRGLSPGPSIEIANKRPKVEAYDYTRKPWMVKRADEASKLDST